jgi:hypothetical protein
LIHGPDERAYIQQAQALHDHGVRRGFRLLADRYLSDPAAAALPSPVRWGWLLMLHAGGRAVALSLAVVAVVALLTLTDWRAALLAASSPLLWVLARRVLQDTAVAAVTLLAMASAYHGSAVGLALALCALLALKEAAGLCVPAIAALWLLRGGSALELGIAGAAAGLGWAAVTAALLGRRAVPVLRRALSGHATDYTLAHQRGHWHRLLVDLAMVSPLPVLVVVAGAAQRVDLAVAASVLIACHALAPVRNVRLILAADLLVRALAMAALPSWALAVFVIADVSIFIKLRRVYDPVTATLGTALGMPANR